LTTFSAAALLMAAAGMTAARAEGPAPVVLELFTSQGCSSCPEADKVLAELAKEPGVLPVSLAVDYWDYLGWKDTLAMPAHGKRQKAYASLRGDRAIYTPQMIVNGGAHVLGNDKAAIERAVKAARSNASETAVPVDVAVNDGQVVVDVAAAPSPGQSGEVWLLPIKRKVPVRIGRGENRGNTVTYTNVVRGIIKLGEWNGDKQTFTRPVADLIKRDGTIDGMVAMLQTGKPDAPGKVLGAANTDLAQ